MFGSCARLLAVASMAALLLVPCANVAPAAATKALKPSERVRTIKAGESQPGPQPKRSSVAPFGRSPLGTASSQSLPGSGPPLLLNKPGLTFDDGGNVPVPDPTGAIGPNHYVEMVNSAIGVYDRDNLNLISKARLDGEFVRLGTGFVNNDFFDPQIQWDEQGQRWLYAGLGPQVAQFPHQYTLVFGWSKTNDPSDVNTSDGTSGWCQYVLVPPRPPTDHIQRDDYPKLGHSDNHIIIGVNVRIASQELLQSRIWTIPKPAPGVTTCPAAPTASMFGDPARGDPLRTEDGDNAFTPVPANTLESTNRGYIVAADNPNTGATASQIMAWHIEGPPNSPTLVPDGNMNVSSYAQARVVPQPGVPDVLNVPSMSPRLTAAVMASDPDAGGAKAIWTQHAIDGPGGRSQARWYELLPATKTVRQEGTISSPLHYVFNPGISPTKRGNEAVINYNLASSTQVPQIAARSRRSDTPLGEMSGETIIGTSDAPLVCADNPPEGLCSWGDYAGASPDPKNVHAVWGSNELVGPQTRDDNWTSRNFAVSVRRPRMATFEGGQVVNPLTGFDSAVGSLEARNASDPPGAYEGTKYLRAIHWPQIGPAQGRFSETLPNGSDVWYGAAFHINNVFKSAADNVAMLEWRDPVSHVHGGISLRSDDKYHVVRGNTASPTADINVGPAFDLPQNRYIWLEVHQRLDTVNPLTEVFLDGHLIMTTAAQNAYLDSLGIPTRVSYGIGTVSSNAFQLNFDRASLDVRQVGAVGAPATPGGFTGSGQDRTNIMYWNPVPSATSYRVYRREADGTWVWRFNVTTTAVFDSNLTNCVTYRYRVTAFNGNTGLESVVSEPLALTPRAPNQQC